MSVSTKIQRDMGRKRNDSHPVADLTTGPLLKPIILFALPLAASSMLQQLFNSADTAVVGRFASSQDMAAVGSNSAVINLIISLFTGLSVGANVVLASLIGRRQEEKISDAIHTVMLIAILSGGLLLIFGMIIARPILELIGTPEDVMEKAVLYLRIYCLGMPFIMIYNFGSAVLRSMGDSRRPFISLVIAGIVNVLLNLLLVIVFHLAVAGVAIATVISNGISSGMVIVFLMREKEPYRLCLRKLRIRREHLARTIAIGAPAGLQGVVFALSNTVIQAGINSFGSSASAGSAAAMNFEFICFFTINAFNQASITFTSQNYAAGEYRRCKQIYRICLISGILSCLAMNLFFIAGRGVFLRLFSTDEEVLSYAYTRFFHVLLFQSIAATYEVSGSTMRGMGYSMTPALLTVFGTCLFRIIWAHTIFHPGQSFASLLNVYPASWILTGTIVLIAYFLVRKKALRD